MRVMSRLFLVSLVVVITGVLLASRAHAAPATFSVTNTNDSGAGSLRKQLLMRTLMLMRPIWML